MSKKHDEEKQLNEELDRLLLHDVAQMYLDESSEYEELLKETLAAGPHQFSKAHEERMRQIIAKADRKKLSFFTRRGMRRLGIAAAAVLLFFGVGGNYLVSDADWQDLRNFFMQRQTTHTEVILPQDIGEEYWNVLKDAGWDEIYYPSYLPDGFILERVQVFQGSCILVFECDGQALKITQSPLVQGDFFHVDTQRAKTRPVEINGYHGEYFEKGTWRGIHLKTEKLYLILESDGLSEQNLAKVTKNLKIVKNAK